jgi:Methyltransferase domain
VRPSHRPRGHIPRSNSRPSRGLRRVVAIRSWWMVLPVRVSYPRCWVAGLRKSCPHPHRVALKASEPVRNPGCSSSVCRDPRAVQVGTGGSLSTVGKVDGADHWDDRYGTIGETSVSWFEETPTVSLMLLDELGVTPRESVVDIGGGASRLVDRLLERGHRDVAVLDISAVALREARHRLGEPGGVEWIERDLLSWEPPRRWSVWHDRAVLHFLVDDADRASYVGLLRHALEPGGAFVIGVFAEDGPMECSGLPVRRSTADELVDLVGDVEVVAQLRHVHRTPRGADQPFNWLAGRLRG